MRIVMATGRAGAGKSTALRALEDVSFFCIDNLPLPQLPETVALLSAQGISDLAVCVDVRQEQFLPQYRERAAELRAAGHDVQELFLDAPDEVLVRRYSESRRRHPLSGDDLKTGIARERVMLDPVRAGLENSVVDTGRLNVHQLKGIIQDRFGRKDGQLAITLLSFGFKNGLPAEADVVFDVRFLPNPYFVEELSHQDGRDAAVSEFVLTPEDARELMGHVERFVRFALPQFQREKKLYLTIAVGCTGGRHRSVAVVEDLGGRLQGEWDVVVRHRDLTD